MEETENNYFIRISDAKQALSSLFAILPCTHSIDANTIRACIGMIGNVKPVDAVPVVRCGDCKHGEQIVNGLAETCISCHLDEGYDIPVHPSEWFCADGERRE